MNIIDFSFRWEARAPLPRQKKTTSPRRRFRPIYIFLFAAALTGCGAIGPRPGYDRLTGRTTRSGQPVERGEVITGIVSYYGAKFHGKQTANGETFDQHALTAAHKTLPFNTRVRVTLLSTGNSVEVRINDRGPFKKNRVLDISYEAAKQIGLLKVGTGRAKIEVL